MNSQAEVLGELLRCLAKCQLRYLIGGSVASSAIGVPRSTLAPDILAEIDAGSVSQLAVTLGSGWYFDPDYAALAVEQHRAFNLIHISSGYKFDLFPAYSAFHQSELARGTVRQLEVSGDKVTCVVATAEDILLAKLRWYLDGGSVSERQWSDIIGILKLNNLDNYYLRTWARDLDVLNLLETACRSAELP